jgi:hypothetical protein
VSSPLLSLARLWPIVVLGVLAGCGSSTHRGNPAPAARPPRAVATRVTIPAGPGHLAAMSPASGLTLRDRPHGRVIARLDPTTEYGSPTIVAVAKRRGDWLGVIAAPLRNNRVGWLDVQRDQPRMWRSRLNLVASLSRRTVELRRGTRVLRAVPVTIGGTSTPTPTGLFAVTDKLFAHAGGTYGCCILALSGHQPHLRPGWAGSDRIAIHGSPGQLVGAAASAGCLRARDRDLEALMKVVPLGTPVRIAA